MFCLLHVEASKVPCNSMESIITVFLSSPTTHNHWLEFVGCDIIEKYFKTASGVGGVYQVAEKRCVSGEHKSLTVPVGEPLFPLGWLADFPGLHLKRLDLQVFVCEDTETQAARFDATCESLDLLGIGPLTFSELLSSWDVLENVIRASVRYSNVLIFPKYYLCMQSSIIQETMASCQS